MCEWGDTVRMNLTIPAHLSHSGKEHVRPCGIDRCIAPIVQALNDAGVPTVASCCGHGRQPGSIALGDGREIIIAPDYETARQIESNCPDIWIGICEGTFDP